MSSPAIDFSKYEEKVKPGQIDFAKYETAKPTTHQETPEEPGLLSQAGSAVANQLGVPASPEDVSEAGSALGSDLWGMVKGAPAGIARMTPLGNFQKGYNTYKSLKETGKTPEQLRNEEQKKAGYGGMYRYVASPLAEGVGVNVSGIEKSAKEGSVGGVLGHAAAVPVATLATYGASKALPPVARAMNAGRSALAERAVAPLVYEGTGEAVADLKAGQHAARGIVREGLVGGKESLVGPEGMTGKIGARVAELKQSANQILENHPNSRVAINVEPEIDAAINDAISAEQKVGAAETVPRLENLREALKTKFGKTTGTPKEINDLKTGIQEAARGRGAYKNTVPMEGSTAKALSDVAARIRARVDKLVPEAADVNQRMSDLLDSTSPITKKLVQERGGGRIPGEGMVREGFRRTIGSAPIRTGAARMLTFGQKAGMPRPMAPYAGPEGLLGPEAPGYGQMLKSRLARFNPPSAFPRKQLTLPGSIDLPSSMEPLGGPSPVPPVDATTRAQRFGLMLPEKAGMARPIELPSQMEPIEPAGPPSFTKRPIAGLLGPGKTALQDYGYTSPATGGPKAMTGRFVPGKFVGEVRNGRWWDGEKWRLDKPVIEPHK